MSWRGLFLVETCCLVNIINTNLNKSYFDGTQALPYCQSVILPIHLFSLAVSTVTQPATYNWRTLQCSAWLWALSHNLLLTAEEHSSLLARRAVAGPPSGCGFVRTGKATPKRDCCRQLHACTVSNSCNCNHFKVIKFLFLKQKKSSYFLIA